MKKYGLAALLLVPALALSAPRAGITVSGDGDTAAGLTLAPWAIESPSDIDRPPRWFDLPPQPVDADAFARDVEHDAERTRAVRQRLQPK